MLLLLLFSIVSITFHVISAIFSSFLFCFFPWTCANRGINSGNVDSVFSRNLFRHSFSLDSWVDQATCCWVVNWCFSCLLFPAAFTCRFGWISSADKKLQCVDCGCSLRFFCLCVRVLLIFSVGNCSVAYSGVVYASILLQT